MGRRKVDHAATAAARARTATRRFCSRCGAAEPTATPGPAAPTRICQVCEDGLLLACAREALPGSGAAFLIVTATLVISAASAAAEGLFARERPLLGASLTDLVAGPAGGDELARAVATAALRRHEPVALPVRGPAGPGSPDLLAQVSTCGPPPAALVTLTPLAQGHGGSGRGR